MIDENDIEFKPLDGIVTLITPIPRKAPIGATKHQMCISTECAMRLHEELSEILVELRAWNDL